LFNSQIFVLISEIFSGIQVIESFTFVAASSMISIALAGNFLSVIYLSLSSTAAIRAVS